MECSEKLRRKALFSPSFGRTTSPFKTERNKQDAPRASPGRHRCMLVCLGLFVRCQGRNERPVLQYPLFRCLRSGWCSKRQGVLQRCAAAISAPLPSRLRLSLRHLCRKIRHMHAVDFAVSGSGLRDSTGSHFGELSPTRNTIASAGSSGLRLHASFCFSLFWVGQPPLTFLGRMLKILFECVTWLGLISHLATLLTDPGSTKTAPVCFASTCEECEFELWSI